MRCFCINTQGYKKLKPKEKCKRMKSEYDKKLIRSETFGNK